MNKEQLSRAIEGYAANSAAWRKLVDNLRNNDVPMGDVTLTLVAGYDIPDEDSYGDERGPIEFVFAVDDGVEKTFWRKKGFYNSYDGALFDGPLEQVAERTETRTFTSWEAVK